LLFQENEVKNLGKKLEEQRISNEDWENKIKGFQTKLDKAEEEAKKRNEEK
jgi:hypothetical protein